MFAYTAHGELRTKTDTGTNDVTSYTYDARGNLLRVDLPTGDIIEYVIDGLNRRVAKKKNGIVQKRWLYRDQLRIAAELDGSGALVSRFVYASRSNVPDFVIRGGVRYRIVSDHLGSPRMVVNASNAADVPLLMRHDAWGRLLEDSAPGWLPFGFAGGLWDPDTERVRFGARDYDPQTGRWTAKDPLMFDGGQQNLYAYANSDVVNRRDPSGLAVPLVLPILCAAGGCEAGAAAFVASAAAIGLGIGWCIDQFDGPDESDSPDGCMRIWEKQNAFCRTLKTANARQACWEDANKALAKCLSRF